MAFIVSGNAPHVLVSPSHCEMRLSKSDRRHPCTQVASATPRSQRPLGGAFVAAVLALAFPAARRWSRRGDARASRRIRVLAVDTKHAELPMLTGKEFDFQGVRRVSVGTAARATLDVRPPFRMQLHYDRMGAILKKESTAEFQVEQLPLHQATPEAAAVEPTAHEVAGESWQVNLLYDGDCPICMLQVQFLTKRMEHHPGSEGIVRFTNLADPDYSPEACGGVTFADGMRRMHAVTRAGEVIVGMNVLRHVYSLVGMEWVYTASTLPWMGSMFDTLYDLWAEMRLFISGKRDLVEKLHAHQDRIQELSAQECTSECEINWDDFP